MINFLNDTHRCWVKNTSFSIFSPFGWISGAMFIVGFRIKKMTFLLVCLFWTMFTEADSLQWLIPQFYIFNHNCEMWKSVTFYFSFCYVQNLSSSVDQFGWLLCCGGWLDYFFRQSYQFTFDIHSVSCRWSMLLKPSVRCCMRGCFSGLFRESASRLIVPGDRGHRLLEFWILLVLRFFRWAFVISALFI